MHEPLWLAIILVTLLGVAAGRLPGLAMNRTTICLVGATSLVLSGAISRPAAWQAIDLDTIVLLLAMMVVNVHLRWAGFFQWVARWTITRALPPAGLLAGLMLLSGILSALFVNDTVVLALTPLVVEVVRASGLPPVPFLMGLATSANIGSVATIIGNPQNMLIGMASGIPYQRFLFALAPVALGGLIIAWILLVFLYRHTWKSLPETVDLEPTVSRLRGAAPDPARGKGAALPPGPPSQSFIRKNFAVSALLLLALLLGMPVAMAALSAASLLLITRKTSPEAVFREIDWSLLVFFAALFVVTRAVETTGLSRWIFQELNVGQHLDVPSLTLIGALLSNLVSNVPAVLLLRPVVELLPTPETAWLTLAMASTLAGNLTLLGSVANLIVAETAQKQNVTLSFRAYLVAGIPITLLTLAWGILWLLYR
ncbi:MAG: anion transporter [Magnetococcales bacterium]|nr:anion transporter [Magnetococcales bacterium]